MTRVRSRGLAALGLAAALPLCSTPVLATAAPSADDEPRGTTSTTGPPPTATGVSPATALDIARAMAVPGTDITGAELVTTPPEGPSSGVGEAMAGFPTDGTTFAVLSTGYLDSVPHPGTFADSALGGDAVRGDTDRDVSVLRVDVDVPQGANCLSFDFKFLSEEFPVYVGSAFNDAFVAELNHSTWTTAASEIEAPDNFAFDADGNVVSINSTGIGGMTPAQGHGTAFDGPTTGDAANTDGAATGRLSASTEVSPGPNSLYLSVFDQGDRALDSAVFVDNLRVGYTPDPGADCVPGAVVVTHDLDLEPGVATAPVGSTHTVTAVLTTDDGTPVAGADLEFSVSGAHSLTGSATTDEKGRATFGYAGTTVGGDSISACYRPEAAQPCSASASATVTWTEADRAVERLGGADRYGTAAEVSGTWTPGVDVAYLASGQDFPDALSVSALAGSADAPVLLTRRDALPHQTVEELTRLQPQRIVVLGGTGAVSGTLDDALAELALADTEDEVTRLMGADRYGTAAAVAMEFPTGVNVAYVATGTDFPDALAGAARSGALDAPIVLTRPGALPAASVTALEHLAPEQIVVLGGAGAVSDDVLAELEEHTAGSVTRVAGTDRYETAVELSSSASPGVPAVFVATGKEFADALTGGPLAATLDGPVLLTRPGELPGPTRTELERLQPERIIVLGGTAAVSAEVEADLAGYLAP